MAIQLQVRCRAISRQYTTLILLEQHTLFVRWQNYISISFHIEWDLIVVTVFLPILNQMEFHLVQNRKENCHHDHIPFNVKRNGNIVFSVNTVAGLCALYTRLFTKIYTKAPKAFVPVVSTRLFFWVIVWNQTKYLLVNNSKEICQLDHIHLTLKGIEIYLSELKNIPRINFVIHINFYINKFRYA